MSLTCKALLLALGFILPLPQNGLSGQTTSTGTRLEIRLAEEKPAYGLIKATSADPKRILYLHKTALVINSDILEVQVQKHTVPEFYLEGMKAAGIKVDRDLNELYEVKLRFTEAAGERMARATAKHIGKPIAILLDGKVISDAIVSQQINDEAVISGDLGLTKDEAQRIARALNQR